MTALLEFACDIALSMRESFMEFIDLKVIFTFFGTAAVVALGGWDDPLFVLLALMGLDYAGGVMHAFLTHTVDSKIGLRGIVKKSGYLVLIVLGVLVDRALDVKPPITHTTITVFLIANECISIFEHLAVAGVPIPKGLVRRLKKLRDDLGDFK